MNKSILVVFLFFTTLTISAQRGNSSPYSYFGIGEEFSTKTVEQNSMGGVGVAFSHYKYLNFTNPAAYADLRYTSYSFGMLHNDLTVSDASGANQNGTATSLSYIALGFPIGQKAGFSFGIQPVATTGYSIKSSIIVNGITTEYNYKGTGGINRLYGSLGVKVFKGFSLGIEGDYSFGNIENSVSNQQLNVSLATVYKDEASVKGGSVSLGAQYHKTLKNDVTVSAGAVYKVGNNLKFTGSNHIYSASFSVSGAEIVRDTLANAIGQKIISNNGTYSLPSRTTLGVGVGKTDKWFASVEYENQNAIEITGFLSKSNARYNYGASNRLSLGGFYIPKINSISSYWDRVTYRAGLRFEKTGLLVNGSSTGNIFTSVDDFGMSFGVGLPLKNQYSSLNVALEYGNKGTLDNNLLKEEYFNLRISLSLTDLNWFLKRKID